MFVKYKRKCYSVKLQENFASKQGQGGVPRQKPLMFFQHDLLLLLTCKIWLIMHDDIYIASVHSYRALRKRTMHAYISLYTKRQKHDMHGKLAFVHGTGLCVCVDTGGLVHEPFCSSCSRCHLADRTKLAR